jgi:hypothetical protein
MNSCDKRIHRAPEALLATLGAAPDGRAFVVGQISPSLDGEKRFIGAAETR